MAMDLTLKRLEIRTADNSRDQSVLMNIDNEINIPPKIANHVYDKGSGPLAPPEVDKPKHNRKKIVLA